MSNGLSDFLSFLFDPVIDFYKAGLPREIVKAEVVQVGQYHERILASPIVGTITKPKVTTPPKYAGWLGKVIAHGIMVQNYHFNYLLDHIQYSYDRTWEGSWGKLWIDRFAEYPPPQWASRGNSQFWSYAFLRQMADNTWHPGQLMFYMLKSWCEIPKMSGYHFCAVDSMESTFRSRNKVVVLPLNKRSGPVPGDPCKAKIEALGSKKRLELLQKGTNVEEYLNCRIQYQENAYERDLFRHYAESMWLVWAGEMWRMHSNLKRDSIPWSWIEHCVSWGIGCASNDRRRRGDLANPPIPKGDEKPQPRFRVETTESELWHVLSSIIRETPPPGSFTWNPDVDTLCPFPRARVGIARPAISWPVTGARIAPIEDFHERDWRDVLTMRARQREFKSFPLKFAMALQKITMALAGAATGKALEGVFSGLVGVSINELMNRSIGTVYNAAKAYMPLDVLNLGNPFDVVSSLNIDIGVGSIANFLDNPEISDEINDINRIWNDKKNYALDLIGDFTEDPRVQNVFNAIT